MTFSQIILQIILGLGTNHNAAIGDFHLYVQDPANGQRMELHQVVIDWPTDSIVLVPVALGTPIAPVFTPITPP